MAILKCAPPKRFLAPTKRHCKDCGVRLPRLHGKPRTRCKSCARKRNGVLVHQ